MLSKKLKVLDLFSGIGGFSLGLERTGGFETVAFCEIEEFPRKVLKKHWADVPIINDVRKVAKWKWKGSKAQTLLRQAFLAKTYHTLEKVPDFPGSVLVYGGKYAEPFAWYDHGSRCWRTWQRCLIEGWERYSEVWPRSGMTRNGIAYQLPTLEPATNGTEYGLLPTPTRSDAKGAPRNRYFRSKAYKGNLCEALRNGPNDPIYPHPDFVDQMMGYPIGYTELNAVGTL